MSKKDVSFDDKKIIRIGNMFELIISLKSMFFGIDDENR